MVVNKLTFKDAMGFDDFTFSRDVDNNVVIEVGDDSVTILAAAYADGRYSIHYDDSDTALGRLALATTEGGTIEATDDNGQDLLVGLTDVDIFHGRDGSDLLQGGGNDDNLYGGGGSDELYGEAGADTLEGGEGTDILEGGAGADTYVFRSGDGADTISGEDAETILVDGNNVVVVNRLTFKDAMGFDDFTFSRDADNNVVIEVGDDSVTILAAAYADGRYSIHYGDSDTALGSTALGRLAIGTTGDNPSLTGTDDADLMLGLAGDDTLEGGIGADFLDGGVGSDTASYASSDDAAFDGLGVTVNLATGEGSGEDAEGDTLVGIENLVGSDYDDTLRGNSEVNIIDGGQGVDTLYGGGGGDTLTGGAGDDTLYGGGDDDTLTGGTGSDYLYGHKGDDTLEGGIGADTLEGGTGDDTLRGGADADTYVFSVGDGADTLYDVTRDTMTLQFDGSSYALTDFNSDNINKVDNDLVITIDKTDDSITDKITIKDAFVTDSTTGTDSPVFTINIQYGSDDTFLEVADAFWNTLS